MSFEEAASIPHAGVLALQGLRFYGEIQPGQKILINGAGGGVGTLGLQLAKHWGAEVTCVDSGKKLDMLLSLGADHVIDYTRENFTKNGKQYDLIVDAVAKHSVKDYKKALSPNGSFVLIGGSVSTIFQVMTMGWWITKKSGKKINFLPHKPNAEDLTYLKELFEDGILKPVIDKSYPLSETAQAVRYLGEGHSKGKVVITM
jgi:NADPH:quinone reductase-like Zn-dependent oxidoreductase